MSGPLVVGHLLHEELLTCPPETPLHEAAALMRTHRCSSMLVVDAGTGQNALVQARQFHAAVGLTGITLTKLDGTAKGGIVFAIAEKLGIPIRFIGIGEGIDDLRPFAADDFVNALFAE